MKYMSLVDTSLLEVARAYQNNFRKAAAVAAGDPMMTGMPADPMMAGMPPGGAPMPPGGAPPMDPAMMDPAMAGMPPGGAPPATAPAPAPEAADIDAKIQKAIQDALAQQGSGGGGGGGGSSGGKKPKSGDEVMIKLNGIQMLLAKITDALGIQVSATELLGGGQAQDSADSGSSGGNSGGGESSAKQAEEQQYYRSNSVARNAGQMSERAQALSHLLRNKHGVG